MQTETILALLKYYYSLGIYVHISSMYVLQKENPSIFNTRSDNWQPDNSSKSNSKIVNSNSYYAK